MQFALDETQQEVKELTAGVLQRATDRSQRATDSVGETGYDTAVWQALSEAGLLSLAVPEEVGGAGLGALETAVVLAEVGRRVVPVPAVATLSLGVLPVVHFGTSEQHDDLLKEVAAGRVLSAALNEPSTAMPRTPRTTARREKAGFVLSGRKTGVMYADSAHRVLVSASVPGEGVGVFLVDPTADGVSLRRSPNSGIGREWTVRLDGVRISQSQLLGLGIEQRILDGVHDFAVAGICATAGGALAGALDLTSEHLRTRTQFDKPLATFQAVAQQVADVYVTVRTLNLAAWSACWRLATGRDATEDLEVAAVWLTSEALPAVHTCHHLHGGLGLDVTYPMHRYYALIKDLARLLGGSADRLDRLAHDLDLARRAS